MACAPAPGVTTAPAPDVPATVPASPREGGTRRDGKQDRKNQAHTERSKRLHWTTSNARDVHIAYRYRPVEKRCRGERYVITRDL
jgi:hypothetical protein